MIYLTLLILILKSCKNTDPPCQSFYYWKTVVRFGETERCALSDSRAERLYLRYFDVVTDGIATLPDATVIFKDTIPGNIQVVPVVFIVNKVLEATPADSVAGLAERICTRIESISRAHDIKRMPEIQIDCDWSASTRDKYFHLLNTIRNHPFLTGKDLSATLRLHQLKYRKSTGIPPVDRVALMCYNMGRLTEYGNRNSILNAEEVHAYTQGVPLYPLPADIAFPLFSWGVCFGNQQYRGLINGLSQKDMQHPFFTEITSGLYRADSSFSLRGAYIRKGDHIRLEEPSIDDIKESAEMIASQIKNVGYVIWYHLDSLLLQKYPAHELQKVTGMFR